MFRGKGIRDWEVWLWYGVSMNHMITLESIVFLTFVIIVIKIKMTTKIDNRKLMGCCNYLNQSGSRYMD